MNSETREGMADMTAAFLIGAGLGAAATLLLRSRPRVRKPRRAVQTLARWRPLFRDVRTVVASLGNNR